MAAATGSWARVGVMRDDHHRMGALHLTLTGWARRPASDYSDIPRHLWGDIGLPKGGTVPMRRRFLDRFRRR